MSGYLSVWIAGFAGLAMPSLAAGGEIRFNQDIRPILSQKCIACHGPDAKHRSAELRLDTPEGAYAALKEAVGHAIVPGDPNASAVMARILSDDPEVVMPPPDFNKTVTPGEQALLKRWIEQGAKYEAHWAYVPLERPEVPVPGKHARLVRNPIDAFILHRLEEEGIEPSPADSTG